MVERPESAAEDDETSYSYYEEEIIDDESSTIIEEEVIDEHDFAEIVQAHCQSHTYYDVNNEHDQGGYISITSEELIEEDDEDADDDSSAPPPSCFDGNPTGGTNGSGWQDSLGSCLDITVDVAVQEGARKASQEAQARDEYLQRLEAREALQRKCREQLEQHMVTTATTTTANTQSDTYNGHYPNSNRRLHQDLSTSTDESVFAMQILKERLHIVELAVAAQSPSTSNPTTSTTNSHVPHSLGTAALDKRKQALAELRRLAARDQLARNVDELKSGKSTGTTTAAA